MEFCRRLTCTNGMIVRVRMTTRFGTWVTVGFVVAFGF